MASDHGAETKADPKPARLKADPMISVKDVQDGFEEFFATHLHNRDLHGFLKRATDEGLTWKTSPKHAVLAHVAPLFRILASVADNTILPTQKCEIALKATHESKACNFSGTPIDMWVTQTIGLLKAIFSNFREVKYDIDARRRCLSPASRAECDDIMSVVNKLHGVPEKTAVAPAPSPPMSRSGSSESLRAAHGVPATVHDLPAWSASDELFELPDIFKKMKGLLEDTGEAADAATSVERGAAVAAAEVPTPKCVKYSLQDGTSAFSPMVSRGGSTTTRR